MYTELYEMRSEVTDLELMSAGDSYQRKQV